MGLILLIVVLVLLFGGGGGYMFHRGYGSRYPQAGFGGGLGLIVIVFLLLWFFGAFSGFGGAGHY